jgi:glycine oxidase
MRRILIIGQGIAGTLLAAALQKRKMQVTVADALLPHSASSVAAGIVNPVTGKRFVKSWRYEEFFPVARSVYQDLERMLGVQIWEERPILRLLATPDEVNDWSARCGMAEYADFLGEQADAGDWSPLLQGGFRVGFIRQAARVHFQPLITAYRQKLQGEGVFWNKNISHSGVAAYLDDFDAVVFCRGQADHDNPFFPVAQWNLAKGEALIFRFPNQTNAFFIPDMLKKNIMLTGLGHGLFWAGSNYQWDFTDAKPSTAARHFIQTSLAQILAEPYEIVDHLAAVRPTTQDRRPIIQKSPLNDKVFLFNGLGTKGALLAPYFAAHFLEVMEG